MKEIRHFLLICCVLVSFVKTTLAQQTEERITIEQINGLKTVTVYTNTDGSERTEVYTGDAADEYLEQHVTGLNEANKSNTISLNSALDSIDINGFLSTLNEELSSIMKNFDSLFSNQLSIIDTNAFFKENFFKENTTTPERFETSIQVEEMPQKSEKRTLTLTTFKALTDRNNDRLTLIIGSDDVTEITLNLESSFDEFKVIRSLDGATLYEFEIDLPANANGSYLLTIEQGKKTLVKRLTIH